MLIFPKNIYIGFCFLKISDELKTSVKDSLFDFMTTNVKTLINALVQELGIEQSIV